MCNTAITHHWRCNFHGCRFVRPPRAWCGSSVHSNLLYHPQVPTAINIWFSVEKKRGVLSIQRVEWTNIELRWASLLFYFMVLVCELIVISSHLFFSVKLLSNNLIVQLRQNHGNSLPWQSSSEHKGMTNQNQISQWSLPICGKYSSSFVLTSSMFVTAIFALVKMWVDFSRNFCTSYFHSHISLADVSHRFKKHVSSNINMWADVHTRTCLCEGPMQNDQQSHDIQKMDDKVLNFILNSY